MTELKELPYTKAEGLSILWGIATEPPEKTRANLTTQISACKTLYKISQYHPVLHRLSELAAIETSRTKGHAKGQKAAAKLLDKLLKSIKPDKNRGIQ